MDNVHARWRLNLAGQLAERMCAFAGVQAIVVGGSVARGYADEYSDLELPVFIGSSGRNNIQMN
jgi:predicted nucleotidyltransferase